MLHIPKPYNNIHKLETFWTTLSSSKATIKTKAKVISKPIAEAENIEIPSTPSSNPRKKRLSKSTELLTQIQTAPGPQLGSQALSLLPPKYIKISSSIPTSVYLIDQSIATQIGEILLQQKIDASAPSIELNPGLGLLTFQLTNRLNLKHLTCFEEQPKLVQHLLKTKEDKEELKTPSGQVQIIHRNFLDLPRLHHVDKVDGGNRVATILGQIQVPASSDLPGSTSNPPGSISDPIGSTNIKKKPLQVFGSIPHISQINFTIKSLVSQKILYETEDFNWEDPIYYITLGPRSYWVLNSDPSSGFGNYRPSAVLFQLLFKTQLLSKFPRAAWIPWTNSAASLKIDTPNNGVNDGQAAGSVTGGVLLGGKRKEDFNPEEMLFLKIETNLDTVGLIGRENLITFWYFVRQHLYSRKRPIIPQLEGWIPGCGARLIRQGFNIYSRFGDLTPEQILQIYLDFTSWPEFPGSSFLAAVEKFQTRIETQEEVMQRH